MIKGIFFDLDNCILDTRSLGEEVINRVFEILNLSAISDKLKREVNEALWVDPLDIVVERFQISAELAEKIQEGYRQVEVPAEAKVLTYGDENCLKNLSVSKILVTTGYRRLQKSKISSVNISRLFDEIIIDELDDPNRRKGKKKIFEEVLKKYSWNSNEVLVIGDNPNSELSAAKSLNMTAVQTLRPHVMKWAEADYHIYTLCELEDIIRKQSELDSRSH